VVSLFKRTFNHSVFFAKCIGTDIVIVGKSGSYPTKFLIVMILSVFFNIPNSIRGHIYFYRFITTIYLFQFVFTQGRTGIAVFAAPTLAVAQVTYKLCFCYIIADNLIIYYNHAAKVTLPA